MHNDWLDESQAWIKIAWRTINNLRYETDTILMAEDEEELKRALMKVKEESEKAGWKLNMQKIKIMATNPIIMAHIRGKSTNNDRFYFLEVQNHCGHLFEAMKLKATCSSDGKLSRLDNLLKSRDITLPTNVHVVKAMVLTMEKSVEIP